MESFFNDSINGFACTDESIKIFDHIGKPFYTFPNKKGLRITFNLPEGEFYTSNELTQLKRPLKYVCPELPMPEKIGKYPAEFNYTVAPNRNKCSVDIETGLIILDPDKEKEWTKPFLNFVIFHELGHVHYFTEWKCDLHSIAKMLEFGFNPSQCLYSSYLCLSESQQARKDKAEKFLNQVKAYE